MARPSKPFMDWLLESLTDPEEAAAYINAANKDSRDMFLSAILDVARAHQITKISRKAHVTREHLHRTFASRGNPKLGTLDSVLQAMGLERGDVRPLVAKRPSPRSSPTTASRMNKRISRSQRASVFSGQLTLNFDNPTGVGIADNTKPISRYISQIRTMPKGAPNLAMFYGSTGASKVGLVSNAERTSGMNGSWFPLINSAGVPSGLPLGA